MAAAIADVIYTADLSLYHVPKADANSRFKRQAWKWTGAFMDSVDHVISPSEHFAHELRAVGADTPISAVPNSLDLSGFPHRVYKPHSPLQLVAVGRLSPEKRQYELVQAVARLDSDDYRLTIIGDGPDRRRVESLISSLGLDNIALTGTLPPDEVKRYLYKSDIGILASSGFDNQPMTILEYLASGLPVVYCDLQLTEGLSTSNSLLSKPDPASLARAIKSLSAKDLSEMSRAGQLSAKDFSIQAHAKSLLKIYSSLAPLDK